MDRFEAMALLVKVTEHGSLSAVSRAMHMPLPTLSRKISDLEALLGTRLLIRTTRKLTLTDAGIAYVAAARRILEQVEDAEREAAGEFVVPKGELVITAPLLFGRLHVLPVVTDFLEMFPEIDIRLVLADHNVHLVDDHVDMAVRIGKLPDSSMVATRIGEMRNVICASPALLARHGQPQTPEALAQLPCVRIETLVPSSHWRFRAPGSTKTIEVPVRPRLWVSTAEAVMQAAVNGVGVTRLLHYQVIDAVENDTLRIILQAFEPEPAPISLVHASRGNMPLKMRRFIDFAVPRMRAALDRLKS